MDRTAYLTIYQMYLRAFTKEGTITAAADYLEDIAALGVDYVYLCQVFLADDDMDKRHWSPRQISSGFENPKNPYRMKDYFSIDPEYGTEDDLKSFVAKAHALGLKVLFDLVYYHCGPKAVFLEEHPQFVMRHEDGSPDTGEWAFPRLNFAEPSLREYLYDNMLYWLRVCDVDGYRCDVGSSIPMDFWEEGIRRCRALKKDFFMLDEGQKVKADMTEFDSYYSFFWSDDLEAVLRGRAGADVLSQNDRYRQTDRPSPILRTLDNHDIANDNGNRRFDTDPGTQGVNAALVLNALVNGIFFLYNGIEDCDTHRHSIFYSRAYNGGLDCTVDRNGNRADISERRELLKRLTALRKEYPVAAEAPIRYLHADEHTLVFTRSGLTVGVNLSGGRCEIPLVPDGEALLTHKASFESKTVLDGYGYFVFRS